MSLTERQVPDEEGTLEPIDVRLSVRPCEDCECGVDDLEADSVRQAFNMGRRDGTCHLVLSGPDGVEYERVAACEDCPCFVFLSQDCVPEIQAIERGRLRYAVTLPDRRQLPTLVERLRETGASVSVERILAASDEDDDPPVLTDKQRRTLYTALRMGYYERPRGATLDDVADQLDITASAASQRLNAVKRRLIRTYVNRLDDARRPAEAARSDGYTP